MKNKFLFMLFLFWSIHAMSQNEKINLNEKEKIEMKASDSFNTLAAQPACIANYEPNNARLSAYPISLNTTYSAGIGSTTDRDFYKFSLSSTSNVVITLQNLPKNYELTLYNSIGRQIGISNKTGTADESITLNKLTPGTYFVSVHALRRAYDLTQCYELKVSTGTTIEKKYNLELAANIKSVHDLICPGMQSSANFDVKNTGNASFSGYFTLALTDENDVFKYSLLSDQGFPGTINPNSSYPYKSTGVHVPPEVIPGTYRVRLMYRENASNPWKAVANGAFTSIQTVNIKGDCFEKKYNLELAANIKSVHDLICPGMQSSANFDVKNTGNASFSGYFTLALTDENDVFKYSLLSDQGFPGTINPNSSYPYKSTGVHVPPEVIPGTYRVRLMYRENASNPWKAVANGAFTSIQTVNIKGDCFEKKYNLELAANIKSVHDLICPGMQSSANFDVKNTGNASFSGYFTLALTDENDVFKYSLLSDQGFPGTINPNSSYPYKSTGVHVPPEVIPGTYRVRLMYRENASNPWKAVANGAFTSIQTVNIKGDCFEKKYNLELAANIKSVHDLICPGMQSSANFDVKNTGNASFSGYFTLALTDENDVFKYSLLSDQGFPGTINPNSSYPYKSTGVHVPPEVIPGTYRVRLMYRENASNPWKAVANGAFTSIQTVNIKGDCFEKKYNLELAANIKSVHDLICPGMQSSANFDVKNTGNASFSGYFTLALTDENDVFKYSLLSDQGFPGTINPNSSYPYKSTGVHVPPEVIPGTYRVRLMYRENASNPWKAVANGAFTSIQTVNIKGDCFEVTCNIRAYEPNSYNGNAHLINLNTIYKAGIERAGDKDFYKFTLSSPSDIVVTLQNMPKNYDLKLTNSASKQVGSLGNKAGTADERITVNALPKGTYYVQVYGNSRADYDMTQCYALRVESSSVQKSSPSINENLVNDKNTSTVTLYPNPVTDIINIKGLVSDQEYTQLTIIDRNRGIVKTSQVKVEEIIKIDVSGLSPNIYYLSILGKNFQFIKK